MKKSKNIFLKSAFILLIGGMFTKLLGFIVKVYYTRLIGTQALGLLSIVMPVYSLLLTIANFNINTAISKRISNKNSSKKVLISSIYIMFILNVILIILGLLFSRFISYNLLKNKDTYYPIVACLITLPFISIGYIVKGYFYGKQNVLPHMISNVLEQLFRFIIIFSFLPKVIKYGNVIVVTILILFNVLSESFSVLILYLFLPKKFNIKTNDIKPDLFEINSLLSISIPSISGRLLCNVIYFMEPIILTNIMLYKGFSNSYIVSEYGIYHTYAISLLLFPSFFINAISSSLLPEISRLYNEKNIILIKRRIYQAITISFIVGLLCSIFIFFNRYWLLKILYDTSLGADYLKILCPFFILFYLEAPLSSVLIALDKIKISTFISVSGSIIKIIIMTLCLLFNIGIYSLIVSEIINLIYVILFNIYTIKKSSIFNKI